MPCEATLGAVRSGAPILSADRSKAFRERARLEADRYGPDPWIFVRELLQNSRDAGATHVQLTVGRSEPHEWVACYDDGEGMTLEHARRYLFALYASSKEHDKNQAGKFGVGFWSVLRFEPVAITIRSRPRDGQAWGIRLSGDLERAEYVAPPDRSGTEIVLERAAGDGRLLHRVRDAVWQSARYLHTRDDVDTPLPITINGRSANEPFALGAPSTSFRSRSVRGVVGLGPAPRVELFCRGLRVRSAACLEDLVAPAGRHTSRMRVQFPELPGGLAPQALLESNALEVMLSRSDARDNRALGRLVKMAQRELERLIEEQLAHARPQPWYRRLWDRAATRLRDSLALRTLLGAATGGVVAVAISLWLWGPSAGPTVKVEVPAAEGDPATVAGGSLPAGSAAPRPYSDLGQRYRGPRVDVLAPGSAEPILLRYAPAEAQLHFAALTFPRLADDGSPMHDSIARATDPYVAATCIDDCTDVALPIRSTGGAVRIPVPTGHRVVAKSLRLDDRPLELRASAEGHPSVELAAGVAGVLRYQTVAARDPDPPRAAGLPSLPTKLARLTREVRATPVDLRVDRLIRFVRDEVRYDRSSEMAHRHTELRAGGVGFVERTMAIGAGDCDVQNGLLVALMQSSGVPARLAVGYLGVDGRVLPWLHAWAEYLGSDGRWHIADASDTPDARPLPAGAGAPTGPGPIADGAAALPGDPIDDAAWDDAGPLVAASEAPADDEGYATAPASLDTVAPTDASSTSPDPEDASVRAAIERVDARWPWLMPSIPLLLATIAGLALMRGRTRRDTKLDDSADLSRLLQGVLQQPGAFGHMSALFHRPLVPLVGGGAISLQRARELASRGRLYSSEVRAPLAGRAARAGAAVLDVHAAEGRTVADALGAVDLDRWDGRLAGSWTTPLVDAVNQALQRTGEPWSVRLVSQVTGGVATIDLAPLRAKVSGFRGTRAVIADADAAWMLEAEALFATAPRAAVFAVLDELAERLDLPEERRAPLLAGGARAALLEAMRG